MLIDFDEPKENRGRRRRSQTIDGSEILRRIKNMAIGAMTQSPLPVCRILQEHNTVKIFHPYQSSEPYHSIKQWLKNFKHEVKRDFQNEIITITFEKDEDAMLFKLTWL